MTEPIGGNQDNIRDRRARISAKPGARELIYGPNEPNNILQPLYNSGGLLFPYTPTINDSVTVNYEHYEPVHTNQPFAAFKSVAAKDITVIGTFSTMNQQEAKQNLANIHFLRTITKMYFGIQGDADAVALRGTPPPILLFNAYGTAMFHNVPVIVTTFNIELPLDVDYVNIKSDAGSSLEILEGQAVREFAFSGDVTAWLPTRFIISVTLQVQNTPDRLRRQFNLNDFRTGKLIKRGGWI